MPISRCPRLFVYDLPSSYREGGKSLGIPRNHFGPSSFPAMIDAPNLQRDHLHLRQSNYVTGAAFFKRAMEHACRTTDFASAELYFVPSFTHDGWPAPCEPACAAAVNPHLQRERSSNGWVRSNRTAVERAAEEHCRPEALLERLRAQGASVHVGSDALDDIQAARTIFFSPRHGGTWENEAMPCGDYEFSLASPRLRGTARLAIEEPTSHPLPAMRYLDGVRSVPHLSYVYARPSSRWDTLPWRQLTIPNVEPSPQAVGANARAISRAAARVAAADAPAPLVRDITVAAAFMIGGSPSMAWRFPLWKRPVAYGR